MSPVEYLAEAIVLHKFSVFISFYILQDSSLTTSYDGAIIDVTMGGICFVLLTGALICHFTRIALTFKYNKVWCASPIRTPDYTY